MQAYIEQEQVYFYVKDGKDMVELHVDDVYV